VFAHRYSYPIRPPSVLQTCHLPTTPATSALPTNSWFGHVMWPWHHISLATSTAGRITTTMTLDAPPPTPAHHIPRRVATTTTTTSHHDQQRAQTYILYSIYVNVDTVLFDRTRKLQTSAFAIQETHYVNKYILEMTGTWICHALQWPTKQVVTDIAETRQRSSIHLGSIPVEKIKNNN